MTAEEYLQIPIEFQQEIDKYFGIKSPKVIFDIGACEGLDSIKYARRFPGCTVFSFEPVEANFQIMRNNLLKFEVENVVSIQKALGAAAGKSIIHLSSGAPKNVCDSDWNYGNKSSSLLSPNQVRIHFPWMTFESSEEIEVDTLEAVKVSQGVREIDLVHMDVQGLELQVLKGGRAIDQYIKMIWLEVEEVPLYEGQALRGEIEQHLASKGFLKVKDTLGHISGDQLWINRAFFPWASFKNRTYKLWLRIGALK